MSIVARVLFAASDALPLTALCCALLIGAVFLHSSNNNGVAPVD